MDLAELDAVDRAGGGHLGAEEQYCNRQCCGFGSKLDSYSLFRTFADPDPNSEYGSGSTQVNIRKITGKRCKIELEDINSSCKDSASKKFIPVPCILICSKTNSNCFHLKYCLFFCVKLTTQPSIRIQIQCIWIQNTGSTVPVGGMQKFQMSLYVYSS